MGVVVKRARGEVRVPATVLTDKQLSFSAKGLYAYLLLMEDPEHVTLQGISMDNLEHLDNVKAAALELEAYGYVEGLR